MKFKNINVLTLTSYLSLIYFLVFLLLRIILVFSYTPDLGGIEGNVIYSISKVLYGGLLYDNPEANNFNITQYSPVFYYINIFFCKLFGLNPLTNLHDIYILGRALSLIFNLTGGYFIYRLLVKIYQVDKRVAIISVAAYFIQLTKLHFSARPDSLFSLLFILMIYCFAVSFANHEKRKNNFYFFLALLMVAISIFVKQTAIQYLCIIPFFFILMGKFKRFFMSGLVLFILTSIGIALFYLLYKGNFVLNVYGGLNNGVEIMRSYDVFSQFFLKYQFFFIIGVFVSFVFFNSKQDAGLRFISFNVIALFIFAFVTSIKLGSWINYYNEFVIAAIILFAILYNKYSKEFSVKDSIYKWGGNLLSLYIVILLPNFIMHKVFHEHLGHIRESAGYFKKKENVAKLLDHKLSVNKDNYFLAFDENICSMLADKATIPNKDIVPSQSKFNYKKFDDMINVGRLLYVVVGINNKAVLKFMGHDFSQFEEVYKDDSFIILQNNLQESVVSQ